MCAVAIVAAEGDFEDFDEVGDTIADSGADLFVAGCIFFGSVFAWKVPVEIVFLSSFDLSPSSATYNSKISKTSLQISILISIPAPNHNFPLVTQYNTNI